MNDEKENPQPPPPPGGEAGETLARPPDTVARPPDTLASDGGEAPGAPAGAPEGPPPAAGGHTPQWIGGYRIIRKLGEGGMGVVYEAEQQVPRRSVALKVIRGGACVDDIRVRQFMREAQSLARLKHPAIAAIYEAGCTDEGQHFFAMELVRGEPLGEYLKTQPLEGPAAGARMREQLRMFLTVCEAINYAHQRGVIHRDLKPSNILVTPPAETVTGMTHTDRLPQVKVLDFGLARITDTDVSVATMATEAGTIQGTLPYMSPEQARGNPDEIDIRTDVYSLGVILYEMLTGNLPCDTRRALLHEAVRVICEEEPRRPSTHRKMLRGDLDTIALKALEKDPDARYQSAGALAEDIQRYLVSQPILARPPSTAYQLKKLVMRHKAPFAFAGCVLVLVIAFGIWMSFLYAQSQRNLTRALQAESEAAREAETAKQVSDFLVRLFEVSDPSEARGNSVTARDLLDEGAERIADELEDQPEVQATLMNTMGTVYQGLGLYREAAPLLEGALDKRRALHGDRGLDVAESFNSLAGLFKQTGELARADSLYQMALGIREEQLPSNDPAVASSLNNLATLYWQQGKYEEAEPLFRRALAIWEEALGPDDPEVAKGLNNLGALYWRLGRYSEAEPLWERCLAIWEKTLGPDHPDIASILNNLGMLYQREDRLADADSTFRRALAIGEKAMGPDHPLVASDLNNLGSVCRQEGRLDEAEKCLKRALAIWEQALGPDHHLMANGLNNLAEVYMDRKQYPEAESLLVRALAIREKALGRDHPSVAVVLQNLGTLYTAEGRYAEAEKRYARALELRRNGLGPNHVKVAETLEGYAALLRHMRRDAEAESMEREAAAIRQGLAGGPS